MERRTLGLVTVGLLAALFVLVVTVPIGGTVGAVLFAIVVVLLGVLFLRFGPGGDVWDAADQLGINPWLFVLLTSSELSFGWLFASGCSACLRNPLSRRVEARVRLAR